VKTHVIKVALALSVLLAGRALAAKTFVVDGRNPKAADANVGTAGSPMKTIRAAVAKAGPGDTVVVRPGVYREQVVFERSGEPGRPIVLRSEKKHAAVITGADVITGWRKLRAGVWFYDKVKVHSLRGSQNQRDGRRIPGNQVFFDGEPLMWALDTARLLPGTWHLDRKTGRVFIAPPEGAEPANSTIEVAVRAGLIFSRKPLEHIHIIGFHVTRDASDVRGGPTGIQILGRYWLVADNLIDWCSTRGLSYRYSADATIRGNRFAWNGQMALGGGGMQGMTFTDNEILFSNWRRVSLAWEAGGLKFASTVDSHVARNRSAYNYGPGIWFDGFDNGNLIERNVIHDNLGLGIFTEIDWHQVIRENLVYNTFKGNGIQVAESSGCFVARNVVFNCGGTGLYVRGSNRRKTPGPGYRKRHLERYGYMTPVRKARQEAELMIYACVPKTFKSVNTLFWENLSFDNAKAQYFEYRRYGREPRYKGLIDNQSDRNIFWSDDPKKLFAHAVGTYSGFEEWKSASGRDADSRVLDPRAQDAKLPAWVADIVELKKHRYRKISELAAMDLRVIDSPAAAVLYSRLVRSPKLDPLKLADGDLKAVVLEIDGERAVALWNTQAHGRKYIRLAVGMRSVKIESPWLNVKTVRTDGGALEVPVAFMPVYVRGVGASVGELPSNKLEVRQFNEPGEDVTAKVIVVNPLDRAQKLSLEIQPIEGWTAEPAKVEREIPRRGKIETPVTLTYKGRAPVGAYTVRMSGTLGTTNVERVALYMVGEGAGLIPRAPGEITVDGRLSDWGDIVKGASLGSIGDAAHLLAKKKRPVAWTGAGDCSASFWAAWDADALYLAARVTDDKVVQSRNPNAPWIGDAIEIFIDGRAEAMQWQTQPTTGCYQIGIGPATRDKPETLTVVFRKKLARLQAASKLTDSGYVIEVRIPFTLENFPAGGWRPGRIVRISILLNDADDPQDPRQECVLGWGHNATNYKDTTGWLPLKLAAKK